MADAEDSLALASHTRRFLWATLGVIVPLATLLVLFPSHTAFYWMWAMRDPRSAILVGTVYAGATVYYVLALLRDDWLETQAGLEGIFTVSAVLLLAVIFHWDVVRPWHPMTLVWMPAYYVPLFFVPYLFRLEGGWARLPQSEQVQIPQASATWLTVRGLLYAALAAAGFVLAGPVSRAWPWAIDPVEVRMFLGQPATFILSALAVLRGNLLWRRHRLPLLYLGSLGVVQLVGLLVVRTPYRWASPSLVGLIEAVLSGFPRDQSLLGLVALNSAGHVFHLATGVVALIMGLGRTAGVSYARATSARSINQPS